MVKVQVYREFGYTSEENKIPGMFVESCSNIINENSVFVLLDDESTEIGEEIHSMKDYKIGLTRHYRSGKYVITIFDDGEWAGYVCSDDEALNDIIEFEAWELLEQKEFKRLKKLMTVRSLVNEP